MPEPRQPIFGISTMSLPAAKSLVQQYIEAAQLDLLYQRQNPVLRGLGK
jgi:hypothetical protein